MKNKTNKTSKTNKANQAAPVVVDIKPVSVATGATEATSLSIANDIMRSKGLAPVEIEPVFNVDLPNELTSSVKTWNCREPLAEIKLREDSNILHRFEYVPAPLYVGKRKTRYSILTCSDNGAVVGKPFAESYSVLNNDAFIRIIETICTMLDSLGIKYKVATTGTLMGRERMFISIQLSESDFKIGEREFKGILNCLNSIPSNSGCTVTFANNSFCVCCENTFSTVLLNKDGSDFHAAIKHTKGMSAALSDVPRMIEAYFTGNKALFANLKTFSEFPIGLVDCERIFTAFLNRSAKGELTDKGEVSTRSDNQMRELQNLFIRGRGNSGETALDMFSAVTEYYTHMSAGKSDNNTKQVESSEIGTGAANKREFYSALCAMIQDKGYFQNVARVGETLLVKFAAKNRAK